MDTSSYLVVPFEASDFPPSRAARHGRKPTKGQGAMPRAVPIVRFREGDPARQGLKLLGWKVPLGRNRGNFQIGYGSSKREHTTLGWCVRGLGEETEKHARLPIPTGPRPPAPGPQ